MRIVPLSLPDQPQLSPDVVWDGFLGDFALTAPDDPSNPASLKSDQALATAVLVCLMTDVAADPAELRDGDENKGWPGDAISFGPGDRPLGSKLWLLRRSALDAEAELRAADYAREALQPLIDQGAMVRWEVTATANRTANQLALDVRGYGRNGVQSFHKRYGVLWDQLNGV
ncbi:phage GP46 family protein [Aurantimonas coralicida]|uniref:phage GP46 family protein n=1 Tax=Aurantimonas coralicida TaxID=182270 RepID=UPI001D195DCF|nr:phage GP46 family protein [Aurantimonas coralicida]MCC4298551.1 phage GP46 family protein [Aurantimonas coralicida]